MVSSCRVSVQWQKTCNNRKDTIWVKLWKASMERWPCGTIKVSKSRKVSCRITEKLRVGYEVNGRSTEEHKKAVWQEKMKSSRIKDWRQCVAREQKYPIKLTFKEVGQ